MADKGIDLTTTFLDLELRNPIIVGSCGLTQKVDRIQKCADAGAGAVVLKSLFEEQITAQVANLVDQSQDSFWHPEAAEYVQAYGRENAVEQYLELIREAKKAVSIPVIASVHCVSPDYWTDFAREVEQAGADALELNVFVMPSELRRSGVQNEQVYFDIVREVKKRVSLPIAVKIGYFFSNLARMIERLGSSGAAGLVLFNRFYSPDFDIEKFKIVAAPHLSTPEEIYLPLRWIALMSGRTECDLAATTGIHDGTGLIKQLLAGAQAVEIASTLYTNGLERIGAMLGDLEAWMERHGHHALRDFRGRLNQADAEDPAAYERVQFMKLSVGIE